MKTKQKKYVYFFGADKTGGNADMRELRADIGATLAALRESIDRQ